MDSGDIVHALRSHGDRKREAQKGQVAISKADVMRVPRIVALATSIGGGKRIAARPASLVYQAEIGRWRYTYVEQLRPRAGQAAFKTLWKRRK